MIGIIRRLPIMVAVALAPLAFVILVPPGVSYAAECGQGTVYDVGSDACVESRGSGCRTATATAPAASLERSHTVGLGEHLRAHSICIVVRRHLSPRRCWQRRGERDDRLAPN